MFGNLTYRPLPWPVGEQLKYAQSGSYGLHLTLQIVQSKSIDAAYFAPGKHLAAKNTGKHQCALPVAIANKATR
nr:hypothetical protein [uncultured Paraburkholderia sp.]